MAKKPELSWTFPPLGGGRDQGLAQPGVETFKGDYEHHIARESIQNSLDARAGTDPVEVVFRVDRIDRNDIPHLKDLADHLEACGRYWPKDLKAKKFFRRAAEVADAQQIPVLRVSDFNTTGVSGGDNDRNQGWHSLTRSTGASSKGGGEGGSFGIGKTAMFAASQLRTVFYSTRTDANKYAFQGVALLTTHEFAGEKVQECGFLGLSGGSVRQKGRVPAAFRRDGKPGTDVVIVGYEPSDNWKDELVASVVWNFWPAIHWGDLRVVIGNVKIWKTTLPKLMEQHGGDANAYYAAYTSAKSEHHRESLSSLGNVELRLLPLDTGPKKVALVRKTGMVIDEQMVRAMLPYAGVFECRNEAGNKKLREMEPPRHDKWDPNLPEKNANTAVKEQYTKWLREKVQALSPTTTDGTIDLDELSPYLPDDEDTAEPGFGGDGDPGSGNAETFEGSTQKQTVRGKTVSPSKVRPRVLDADAGDDDDDGPGGEQDEDTGGGGGGSGFKGGGKKGGGDPRMAIDTDTRAFAVDEAGLYQLVVRAAADVEAVLQVVAVGDDPNRAEAARVASAWTGDKDEESLPVTERGEVGPVSLNAVKPLVLTVKLDRPRRLAVEVVAYEIA